MNPRRDGLERKGVNPLKGWQQEFARKHLTRNVRGIKHQALKQRLKALNRNHAVKTSFDVRLKLSFPTCPNADT
jgi:hypothetical protein